MYPAAEESPRSGGHDRPVMGRRDDHRAVRFLAGWLTTGQDLVKRAVLGRQHIANLDRHVPRIKELPGVKVHGQTFSEMS